jgi:pheromone a factor receptor
MLLILSLMIWHFHNRNTGPTSLVTWTALLLAFDFINAVIWPNDDIDHWYNGVGLYDFEVNIQIASETGRAASLACILRAFATVVDMSRATLIKTKAQRWRECAIDLTCCLGFPLLQMVFHYIVQNQRYHIYGISGCFPANGMTLATVFLIGVPALI